MASILFVTLYDEYCLGVRQLVSNVRAAGHDAYLLCLKQYGKRLLKEGEEVGDEWQIEVMPNGSRSVLCYPFPVTEKEWELAGDLMRRLNPDVVGCSVYTPQIRRTAETTEFARKTLPEATILWGGPHATLNPDDSCEYADYVMVGEGDVAMIDFLNLIKDGGDLRTCPSICYRDDGGVVVKNELAPLVQDLDTLPFTYHGDEGVFYLDNDELLEGEPFPTSDLRRSHKLMTSRGCPYACTYCMLSYQKEAIPESTKLRYRSIKSVIDELKDAKSRLGNFFCELEDDIFTLRPERMEDFFDEYRSHIDMPFWCYTHPQYARPQMLQILHENHCQFVVMGIESGSDRVANEVFNRKVKMSQVVEASKKIAESGLRGYYDLISNNPFETEEDRIETFHLVRSLHKPFELQLVELNFYPNIKVDRMRRERGLPAKVDLFQYRYWNALYHLASCIDITDAEAEFYLSNPIFREKPEIIEGLAREAKKLRHSLGDAEIWNRNFRKEIERQQNRAKAAEAELADIKWRKGFRHFYWVTEKLRSWAGMGPNKSPSIGASTAVNDGFRQDSVMTEVTAPLDFRPGVEGDRASR
jgi:anaerobic magnesium-protoporphyrin IX monomethyl ester cyclase